MRLNGKQSFILRTGAALLVAMSLYVPYTIHYPLENSARKTVLSGYAFIGNLPVTSSRDHAEVNTTLMLTHAAILLAAIGLAVVACMEKDEV